MAKFCGNCGTQNEDIANVCGNCGTPLAAESTTEVVAIDPAKQEKLKKQVMLIGIGTGALVVVIYLIWLILHLFSPRPVFDCFMDAFLKCDADKFEEIACEYQADLYDKLKKEVGEEWGKIAEKAIDGVEDKIGSNPHYSFEIEDEHAIEEKKYDNVLGEKYEDIMDDNDFTELYEYKVKIKASKDGEDKFLKATVTMVKEGGSWKVYSWTWNNAKK